ncbi:hypothetical protein AMTRI_Chr10g2230 [Amborella trichopoda]
MCLKEESNPHLFLHCSVAYELWTLIHNLFSLKWDFPPSVKDLFFHYLGGPWPKAGRTLWRAAIAATVWVLWLERNEGVFQGHKNEVSGLFHKVTSLVTFWASTHNIFGGIPMSSFLRQWDNIIRLQPFKLQRPHN